MMLTLMLCLATALAFAAQPAAAVPYAIGDVFAGVGNGHINQFSPTGTLKATLDTTLGNTFDTGMCFDSAGNLYATNFSGGMTKFDNQGNVLVSSFGSGFNADPESCVRNQANQIYVGQADGSADVLKFDTSGNPLATYDPATGNRGTDWVELAADQCTLYYTSEDNTVRRFDVCTNTQLADFATGLPAFDCYALRIRSNGEVMVACSNQVVRLDSAGTVIQTYPATSYGSGFFFAMNLDPDGQTFWTADINSGLITRINIATGAQVTQFSGGVETALAGLAIFGEITQGGGGGGGGQACTIKVSNGGWIVTDDGDRASFGGIAKETSTGVDSGSEEYQDHGPAEPLNVHSLSITDVTCNETKTQASIFGQATIDGTGSHSFQIDVQDNGEPGKGTDHYRIRLDTGYDSGDHTLRSGNVQIR
jgi:sugar lactone lactonase YvrE